MKVVCVVEGDGEVEALPVLLRRIAADTGINLEVARPLRTRRDRFLRRHDEMARMLGYAALAVREGGFILVLLDADDDCIAQLVAQYADKISEMAGGALCVFVLANREFESWFVAAAESLRGYRRMRADITAPIDPESIRDAKGWMREHMENPASASYRPAIDQPAFASKFDWRLARTRSPSLDKLCRELDRLSAG